MLFTELIYFIIIFSLCALIYYKTRPIYQLTKHKGIFHFRNIFLFFGLAYFFRLIVLYFMLTIDTPMRNMWVISQLTMPFVSLFSTMAILSILVTIFIKNLKNIKGLTYWILGVSILASVVTFLTRSHQELLIIQTFVFLFALLFIFLRSKKEKKKNLISQNSATYLLLFIFWIFNSLVFSRRMLPPEYKIPVYVVSAGIFFWIYYRVQKRLSINAKKKG